MSNGLFHISRFQKCWDVIVILHIYEYPPLRRVNAMVKKRVHGHTSSSPIYPGLTLWRSRPSWFIRLMSKAGMIFLIPKIIEKYNIFLNISETNAFLHCKANKLYFLWYLDSDNYQVRLVFHQ